MSFDKDLAKAQAEWEKSKETAAAFGQDIPVGVYAGRLTSLALSRSQSSGNIQVKREITISEGDYKGAIVRDYNGIGNDIGLAILRQFIEMCGYECPEKMTELPATLEAIQNDTLDISFSYRLNKGGYPEIRPMEVAASADAGDSTPADEVPADEVPADGTDELLDKAKAFAVAQGIDVEDGDDLDSVREKLSGYLFPVGGVKAEQLKDIGFDDPSSVTPLSDEDAGLLEEISCGDSVVRPDAKYDKPKAPAKAPAKAPQKAVVKKAVKK